MVRIYPLSLHFPPRRDDDELQCLHIRNVQGRIVNLSHHAVGQRKPDFRTCGVSSAESLLRCSRPVRVVAGLPWGRHVSCLGQQSREVNSHQLLCLMLMGINFSTLLAQTTNMSAPGQPGNDAHWPTAAKQGFGAANTTRSKVWFTLADGVMTEVYYPTLDVPNVQTLQLIVVAAGGKV